MADPGFLNVDLEVGARTRTALAPLIAALDGALCPLFCGRVGRLYRATYEINGHAAEVNATIHALVDVIEQLDARALRAWKSAPVRELDIGVELAPDVHSIKLALDPSAVARVVSVGGTIVFTAYQGAAMRGATRKARDRRRK